MKLGTPLSFRITTLLLLLVWLASCTSAADSFGLDRSRVAHAGGGIDGKAFTKRHSSRHSRHQRKGQSIDREKQSRTYASNQTFRHFVWHLTWRRDAGVGWV